MYIRVVQPFPTQGPHRTKSLMPRAIEEIECLKYNSWCNNLYLKKRKKSLQGPFFIEILSTINVCIYKKRNFNTTLVNTIPKLRYFVLQLELLFGSTYLCEYNFQP